MEHLITIKMRYPTTTMKLGQPLTLVQKVQLISVHGITGVHSIYCGLIETGRSFSNAKREHPTEEETLDQSTLLATVPSDHYASLNVRTSNNPIKSFSVTVLNENGSMPFFDVPITVSLKVTLEEENND